MRAKRLIVSSSSLFFTPPEWAQAQYEEPVNQPSYYSQYGPVLHDLASYQHKLYQQGLAPTYGQDLSPPFILTNNMSPDVYGAYQANSNPASYHNAAPASTHKGKHKCNNHNVKTDKKESEHAKKPIPEIDIKWPHIKHDKHTTDKAHAGGAVLEQIVANVGEKASAIKEIVEQSVERVNKTAAAVGAVIGSESSTLIDRITKRLKSIENQLQRLKFGTVKSSDDEEEFFDDDDDDFDELRANVDDQSGADSGKKFRSLGLDAELRGNLKSSISDAVRGAQEKFNKLIDDQVAKINYKIEAITNKFEYAIDKIQDALHKLPTPTVKPTAKPAIVTTTAKVYTPPTYKTTTSKYPTVDWDAKTATTSPAYSKNPSTTPEYYKYTDMYYFKAEPFNRMDVNVDALEIADSAKDELPKAESADDAMKSDNSEVEETSSAKPIDEADEVKALDDLQSRVVETVKDALKSDDGDLPTIGDNQSEALDNPEDKLKTDASDIEATLAEELRKELVEQEESLTTSQPLGEPVKSLESINIEADDAIEDIEMRSLDSAEDDNDDDNPIESVDVDEGKE
jgi:hypothetical protein